MKVWLDDERPAPDGWLRAYSAPQAIDMLEKFRVLEISLDHDLGNEHAMTGYDVLTWIESRLADGEIKAAPRIHIHTANPAARPRMIAARDSIERLQRMIDGAHE